MQSQLIFFQLQTWDRDEDICSGTGVFLHGLEVYEAPVIILSVVYIIATIAQVVLKFLFF
jgi:hypothetical protein